MEKPKTRKDCGTVIRPCQWANCRYHVLELSDPSWENKLLSIIEEDKPSCVLDMAELGGLSEKEIAPILGISTSTTYDIEESALRKLKNRVSHEKN
jgi:hypothetical protein